MSRSILTALVMGVALAASPATAQDIHFTSNAELVSLLDQYETRLASLENNSTYGSVPGYGPDCRSTGLSVEVEATLFRYYRADGVRTNSTLGSEMTFGLQAAPRVTVGYTAANGMGIRARWWEFSQVETGNAQDPADFIDVDTYTVDVEVFQDMILNDIIDMEISGGVRYNDFREALHDVSSGANRLHLNEFDGIGLLGALEFRAHLYRHGSVFGRGRIAGVVGDRVAVDDITDLVLQNDTIQGMYELALGYQYSRTLSSGAVLFAEVAGELQHWQNFSSGFEDTNSSDDFGGPADVGFAGIVFAAGWQR